MQQPEIKYMIIICMDTISSIKSRITNMKRLTSYY